jgi:protoheme IX farnesyltransferase
MAVAPLATDTAAIPAAGLARPVSRSRAADFLELTKPRITFLVLVTAAVGYALGLRGGFEPSVFLLMLGGTALLSAGAAVLNQYLERETDSRMERTRHRPLPSGRLDASEARTFGLVLSAAGLALLAGAGWLPALLGLASEASYLLLYTPLKRVTPLCTIVGAVPGALPPMIGWAAARGDLGAGAWALFAVLFLWQLPHFLALAWLYRDEYAQAGLPMLTVRDPRGASTGRQAVLYAAALLPVSLVAGALASAGNVYLWSATALGLLFAFCAARFALRRTASAARSLFLVSILYLPALFAVLVLDR